VAVRQLLESARRECGIRTVRIIRSGIMGCAKGVIRPGNRTDYANPLLRRVPDKETCLDIRPHNSYLTKIPLAKGRLSRGYSLGRSGSGSRGRSDTLRSRAAWASSRPARVGPRGARCTGAGEGPPVCIRWFQEARPEPSRGLKNLGCRGGAPKGERARSMRSRRPRFFRKEERREDARRIASRCGPVVRLSALRLPSFKGGVFLGLAF
jgi:hypothetical protein